MPEPLRSSESSGVRRLITVEDRSHEWPVTPIGNEWSRYYYDGPFHLFAPPADLPAVSLVFVQSRDGNTGAANPGDLGGGPTDKILIYEGLSRVAADGVLAGAGTVGASVLFTIAHPQLAALRRDLGLPPHPAQIVLSNESALNPSARIFTTPELRVFVLAGRECLRSCAREIAQRPWVTMVSIEGGLTQALRSLRRDHGVSRISAVGGRKAATSLVDAGLVQDLYLTTSAIAAGEPGTPWYVGPHPPSLQVIVRKREDTDDDPILFEHLALASPTGRER